MGVLGVWCAFVLGAGAVATAGQSESNYVARLSRITPLAVVENSGVALAGEYRNPSTEVERLAGPMLGGTSFYLFADYTYVFVSWTDISPNIIEDKGTWRESGGVLLLTSDSDITWKVNRRAL